MGAWGEKGRGGFEGRKNRMWKFQGSIKKGVEFSGTIKKKIMWDFHGSWFLTSEFQSGITQFDFAEFQG